MPTRSSKSPARRSKSPVRSVDVESPPVRGEPKDAGKKKSGLAGDYGALALLLFLYTLQGIPMGLSASLPLILVEKGASTAQQAAFSTVAAPFALKLLWAPLVDAVYSSRFGRRKTWIVPVQAAIGVLLLYSGGWMDALLAPGDDGKPDVQPLVQIFLSLYFLAATQDIAVDGLALTVLSAHNKELGATCNAVGQTFGTFISYVGFLALSAYGRVTLGGFMVFWGWVFLGSTVWVLAVRRDEHTPQPGGAGAAMVATYLEMWQVLKLPNVRWLARLLLTCKAPLTAFEALIPFELQKEGVSKEKLGLVSTVLLPVSMIAQSWASKKYLAGRKSRPLSVFTASYRARLGFGVLLIGVVFLIRAVGDGGALPPWVWLVGAVPFCAHTVSNSVMFVAQMAFFNRVSDPKIGGTYMTMLNTISNLGGQWPGPAILSAKAALEAYPTVDAFAVVAVGGVALSLAWLAAFSGRAAALQSMAIKQWHA